MELQCFREDNFGSHVPCFLFFGSHVFKSFFILMLDIFSKKWQCLKLCLFFWNTNSSFRLSGYFFKALFHFQNCLWMSQGTHSSKLFLKQDIKSHVSWGSQWNFRHRGPYLIARELQEKIILSIIMHLKKKTGNNPNVTNS